MADLRLPEEIEKALDVIPCNAERGCAAEISMPDLDCQAFHTALASLRRAIAAALLRADADGHDRVCDKPEASIEKCVCGYGEHLRAQAAALEAGE